MLLRELKDILDEYSEFEDYKEIKLSCPQVHGAQVTGLDIWNDGDDIHIIFTLDKDVCISGY